MKMTEERYKPLFVNGKRDKARRYVDVETGKIISRRQYIKVTEGVTPEKKAIERYLKEPEKYRVAPKTIERHMAGLPIKWITRGGVKYKDRGKYKRYWQLEIYCRVVCLVNKPVGLHVEEVPVTLLVQGFSRMSEHRNFEVMLEDAKNHAASIATQKIAKKQNIPEKSGMCEVVSIDSAKWLRIVDGRTPL